MPLDLRQAFNWNEFVNHDNKGRAKQLQKAQINLRQLKIDDIPYRVILITALKNLTMTKDIVTHYWQACLHRPTATSHQQLAKNLGIYYHSVELQLNQNLKKIDIVKAQLKYPRVNWPVQYPHLNFNDVHDVNNFYQIFNNLQWYQTTHFQTVLDNPQNQPDQLQKAVVQYHRLITHLTILQNWQQMYEQLTMQQWAHQLLNQSETIEFLQAALLLYQTHFLQLTTLKAILKPFIGDNGINKFKYDDHGQTVQVGLLKNSPIGRPTVAHAFQKQLHHQFPTLDVH